MVNLPAESEIAANLFSQALAAARSRQLPIGELFGRAEKLKALAQRGLAIELYKAWIAFNPDHKLLHAAYFNYAVELNETADRPGAINALRECLRVKQDFYPAYINLGRVLEDSGEIGQAVMQWFALAGNLSAVNGESVKHKILALKQAGRVLESVHQDAQAEEALRQCIELDLGQTEAIQHWTALRQKQCKWPVIASWEHAARKDLVAGMSPLSAANYSDDPMFQLAKAHRYNKHFVGRPQEANFVRYPAAIGREGQKLRVGYLSSDLREHAVGFALTDVFETHDQAKFEIFAYYCGIARTDSTQARIKAAVGKWTDINPLNDDEAAASIANDKIDILIDLNGYTKVARAKVFARKPAPIIVNWFGYPGTLGSPYRHFIIADPLIIPPEHEIFYSERVLRLPCYQPNDRKRTVSTLRPSRRDAGLPENAFVYCCLNGTQKLTPRVFGRWLKILTQTENSVLWLLSGTEDTNERLKNYAAEQGVAPQRIIFAEKAPNPEHLARYPLADLFLDTLPYGAHTTAADALWMGVPVLTLQGNSFPSRICASLVSAAGLENMICSSPDEYVAMAVSFGQNPQRLTPFKEKLIDGRDSCLLFDTPRLVEHLEELYRQMWNGFEQGLLPVPDLTNLDIYHEVGLDLDIENIEVLSGNAYHALYRQKLSEWNSHWPIRRDARLWSGQAGS
jgi:predicted O-linked N-acetylglucosamine transferase (SPINDLY family)